MVQTGYWYAGQWYNTGTVMLSIQDPALLYGATVFTTLRVYGSSLQHPLTHWQDHCERLQHSLGELGWAVPDWSQVYSGAECAKHHYSVLRITLFPDGREWITGRDLPSDLTQRQQQGISAWLTNAAGYQRSLSLHKTGNYLACWLAMQTASQQGAQEAILTNSAGEWLETTTGNLWGWGAGRWWTPPLTAGILPGIVRSHLIQSLTDHHIPVQEVPWTAALVAQFDTLAYCNSVVEIIPIHTVRTEHTRLDYDPLSPRLQDLTARFLRGKKDG